MRLGQRMSVLPVHGKGKELGTGLVHRIKRDLGLQYVSVRGAPHRPARGHTMDYPVLLERDDNDTILVSFPDFPEAHTFGDTEEEALTHAKDALATAIDAYIKDRREIPRPSAVISDYRVTMPAIVEAKVSLYEAMRAARVNKSELARRLDWHLPQVDRLLAMTHASKLDQLEAAFGALGKRLRLTVQSVDTPRPQRIRRRLTETRARRMQKARRHGAR